MMHRRRRFLGAVSVLTLLGGLLAANEAPAGAVVNPCGPPAHYFAGWGAVYPATQQYIGVSGRLTWEWSGLCSSPSSDKNVEDNNSQWTMIQSSIGGYVQSGVVYSYDLPIAGQPGYPVFFAEYNENGSTTPVIRIGSEVAPGTTYDADSVYSTACACEEAEINGTVVQSTPWNPNGAWTPGWAPQYNDEVSYLANDVPGDVPHGDPPADFNDLGIDSAATHTLLTTCGNVTLLHDGPTSSRYLTGAYTCDHVYSEQVRSGP